MNDLMYVHPQKIWTKEFCEKVAKKRERDSFGDRHPYPGLVTSSGSAYIGFGQTRRYNGGCIRDGGWYKGETIPLPKIPDEFEFFERMSWGTYIRKKGAAS